MVRSFASGMSQHTKRIPQGQRERCRACQPIRLGDEKRGPGNLCMMERCDKLRPLVVLAALNLRVLMDDASLLGRRKQPAKRGFSSESSRSDAVPVRAETRIPANSDDIDGAVQRGR